MSLPEPEAIARHRQVGGRRTNPLLPWLMSDGGSGSTGGAMVGSGQKVAAELEEVVDLAVAGEEPRMPGCQPVCLVR